MKRVFISYHRHVSPDQWLAEYFHKYLVSCNHKVFIDSNIQVGQKWAKAIKDAIIAADYFILLISEESVSSDMILEEVNIAYQSSKDKGVPLILPVRIRYTETLPFNLGAIVNPIQYINWIRDGDELAIAAKLDKVLIKGHVEAERNSATSTVGNNDNEEHEEQKDKRVIAPLPRFDPNWLNVLKAPGGTEILSSPFYIKRETDRSAWDMMSGQGTTLRIKGSRQTGKSSLLARLYQQARNENYQVVYIDFQGLYHSHFRNLDTLLKEIADLISIKLRTNEGPNRHWASSLGGKNKLTNYIEEEVLRNSRHPVVLLMDEVDRIFEFEDCRNDFFSLVRSWHNSRAIEPLWEKLILVLSYSMEASLFITDLNQSPFNVGDVINLTDFNRLEVEDLNVRHGMPVETEKEMESLTELIGGHPFLIRKAFYEIVVRRYTISTLIEKATDDDGPFSEHLHRYLMLFYEHPELSTAMKFVINDQCCHSDLTFYRLRSSGLVCGSHRLNVRPRCNLYKNYFSNHL